MLGLRDLASLRIVYHMYVHLLLRKQMQEACAAENLSGAFFSLSFAMPAKVSFPLGVVLLAHNKTNVMQDNQRRFMILSSFTQAAHFTCFIRVDTF